MSFKIDVNVSGVVRAEKTIDRSFGKIEKKVSSLDRNIKKLEGQMGSSTKKMSNDTKRFANRTKQDFGMAGTSLNGFLKTVRAAALGYATVLATMQITEFVSDTFEAGVALDSLERSFKAITGSETEAAKELEYVHRTATSLGLGLSELESSYKDILAASKNTALEGANIRKVFTAISKASAVLGMSADDTKGSLRALSQMISKGNVQAEELRGQLGERLPGAFQMAAEAMGVTTMELNDMLERGEVLAEELLPRLAEVLEDRFGAAAEKANERAAAAFANLGNAVIDLQRTFMGMGLLEWFSNFAKFATLAVKDIENSLDELIFMAKATWAILIEFPMSTIEYFKELMGVVDDTGDALENAFHEETFLEGINAAFWTALKGTEIVMKQILNIVGSTFSAILYEVIALVKAAGTNFMLLGDLIVAAFNPWASTKPALDNLKNLHNDYFDGASKRVNKYYDDIISSNKRVFNELRYLQNPVESIEDEPEDNSFFSKIIDKKIKSEEALLEAKMKALFAEQQALVKLQRYNRLRYAEEIKLAGQVKDLNLDRLESIAKNQKDIDNEIAKRNKTLHDNEMKLIMIKAKAIKDLNLIKLQDLKVEPISPLDNSTSFDEYIEGLEEATNATNAFSDMAVNAFKGMEDALVEFALTGKLSFKDLMNSMIADLMRFLTRQMMLSVFGGLGNLFSAGSGGVVPNMGDAIHSAHGNAFKPTGVVQYATGGAFTNSIVNRPTPFAHGGGFGVMGEAGPEAILPLARTGSGDLGVKTEGKETKETNIFINAVDSKSFSEMIERDPGSIVAAVETAIRENSSIRKTMKGAMR